MKWIRVPGSRYITCNWPGITSFCVGASSWILLIFRMKIVIFLEAISRKPRKNTQKWQLNLYCHFLFFHMETTVSLLEIIFRPSQFRERVILKLQKLIQKLTEIQREAQTQKIPHLAHHKTQEHLRTYFSFSFRNWSQKFVQKFCVAKMLHCVTHCVFQWCCLI